NTGDPLNLNRGYWSFDTNVAVTWLNETSGTELSVVAGLMANTVNSHTDYHTGTEFHLEYVFNQFVTNFLSVGLHGYYYDQIADDRPGPSATAALNLLNLSASDLRSSSHGLGPQANWIANDNLTFAFSWIHDLYTRYRMPSDYFYLVTTVTF
ncbi:MAG: transporter, partial [Nitrospiraceae bacterium]